MKGSVDIAIIASSTIDVANALHRQILTGSKSKLIVIQLFNEECLENWLLDNPNCRFIYMPCTLTHISTAILTHLNIADAIAEPLQKIPQERRFPIQVLVADDNIVNQQVVSAMLQSLGAQCVVVSDGKKAVERALTIPFQLVLMDCEMPEMDGYEATRQIREQEAQRGGKPLPIVAITAHALDETREACLAAGMDDVLTKPVLMNRLVAILEKWATKKTVS